VGKAKMRGSRGIFYGKRGGGGDEVITKSRALGYRIKVRRGTHWGGCAEIEKRKNLEGKANVRSLRKTLHEQLGKENLPVTLRGY